VPGFFVSTKIPHDLPSAIFLQHDTQTCDCLVRIHAMPSAPQTKTDGLYRVEGQQALRGRLHALPVDGKANEALIQWLGKN